MSMSDPTPASYSYSVDPSDITYTRSDGTRYVNVAPVPCERQAYLALDGDGIPYALFVDAAVYRVRLAPRTKITGGLKLICLGERVPSPDRAEAS
jgi:hypothetical protein